MSNLRERILRKNDRASESLTIPEWDVTVEVRSMSGKLRNRYVELVTTNGLDKESDPAKVGAVMLPLMPEFVLDGVYDPETGERVFQEGDLEALLEKDGEVIQRIAQKVIGLSKLGEQAVDEAGKPSSVTPSGDSTSA